MKKEIFEELPFLARKELIDLRSFVFSALESNTNLIYSDRVDSVLHQLRDYSGQYVFNVKFVDFDPKRNNNSYEVFYKPRSISRIDGTSQVVVFSQLKDIFEMWIELVNKMQSVTEEYYEPFKKFYDEQFADFFSNNDSDSTENPFEIEKQEKLYYFLEYAERKVNASEEIGELNRIDLISDLSQLKQEIPNLTKKQFVTRFSRFAQKAKKISNKLFHDIFDVLKKEAIKKVLYEGVDQLPNIWHKVEGWFNLLN